MSDPTTLAGRNGFRQDLLSCRGDIAKGHCTHDVEAFAFTVTLAEATTIEHARKGYSLRAVRERRITCGQWHAATVSSHCSSAPAPSAPSCGLRLWAATRNKIIIPPHSSAIADLSRLNVKGRFAIVTTRGRGAVALGLGCKDEHPAQGGPSRTVPARLPRATRGPADGGARHGQMCRKDAGNPAHAPSGPSSGG